MSTTSELSKAGHVCWAKLLQKGDHSDPVYVPYVILETKQTISNKCIAQVLGLLS